VRVRRADPALATPSARRTAVSLGRQLHALRKARGLTQQQAGGLLGWEQSQWARLEAGRVYPTLATLDLLASRLGVRIVLSPDAAGLLITLEAMPAAA
jgi:transcriptional regulator with XRE-family HTH domain